MTVVAKSVDDDYPELSVVAQQNSFLSSILCSFTFSWGWCT
jgi:hypothetical protein